MDELEYLKSDKAFQCMIEDAETLSEDLENKDPFGYGNDGKRVQTLISIARDWKSKVVPTLPQK